MRSNVVKSDVMAKKKKPNADGDKKPLTFREAIWLAANTPHLTHKQINELRKKEREKKKNNK